MDAFYQTNKTALYLGDCLDVLRTLPDDSIDACITDPPYALTQGRLLAGVDHCLSYIALGVQFPYLDNRNTESLQTFELAPIFIDIAKLGSGFGHGVNSGVGVPVGAVDFERNPCARQPEIDNEGVTTSGISEGVLPDIANAKPIKFAGDFILKLRDDRVPAFCKGACGCYRQLSPGCISVPVIVRGLPTGVDLLNGAPPHNTSILRDVVGPGDDTWNYAGTSAGVVTGGRTELAAVLTLDLRRRTAELTSTDSAQESNLTLLFMGTQDVGAFTGACCLSAPPETVWTGEVVNTANKAGAVNQLFIHSDIVSFLAGRVPRKGFMGKEWDNEELACSERFWREVYRVLKPGAHLLAFGGTRTCHRMVCAIEDAGFEIRDSLHWVFASGMPKSRDISKAIDSEAGAVREIVGIGRGVNKQSPAWGGTAAGRKENSLKPTYPLTAPATDAAKEWAGWGTGLKPAHEIISMARKPIAEQTIAAQVLKTGTGGLNIDACRIGNGGQTKWNSPRGGIWKTGSTEPVGSHPNEVGRWPANVIFGCACEGDEHEDGCPVLELDAQSGESASKCADRGRGWSGQGSNTGWKRPSHDNPAYQHVVGGFDDSGGASRFFYVAKSSRSERGDGNGHPTVKPYQLMIYLCRLITPPNGLILDPFAGSGTTLLAAKRTGFRGIGIELDEESCLTAKRRLMAGKPGKVKPQRTPEQRTRSVPQVEQFELDLDSP